MNASPSRTRLIPGVAVALAGSSLYLPVSQAAQDISCYVHKARRFFNDSVTYGLPRQSMLEALNGLRVKYSTPDWDGYGAKPIDTGSCFFARMFLRNYPFNLPLPELSVDPDGEVSMEWGDSPRNVFSVSVSSLGRLSYAGLFGDRREKGAEIFTGEVPATIIEHIQSVEVTQ